MLVPFVITDTRFLWNAVLSFIDVRFIALVSLSEAIKEGMGTNTWFSIFYLNGLIVLSLAWLLFVDVSNSTGDLECLRH